MTIVIFVLFLSLPFLVDYAYTHMEFVFIRSTWTIFVIVFRFMLFSNTSVRFLLPDSMTDNDIVNLLKETEHNDYPVVLPWESQYLVGFVLQRDLNLSIGENGTGNRKQETIKRTCNFYVFYFVSQMQNVSLMESMDNQLFCSRRWRL